MVIFLRYKYLTDVHVESWNYFILNNGDVHGFSSAGFGPAFPHSDDYFNKEGLSRKNTGGMVPILVYLLPSWSHIYTTYRYWYSIMIIIPHWLTGLLVSTSIANMPQPTHRPRMKKNINILVQSAGTGTGCMLLLTRYLFTSNHPPSKA